MKPLVLDTTFILPLFGIELTKPKEIKKYLPTILDHGVQGFDIYLPNTCLLETMYLLNREFRKTKNSAILNRFSRLLPTLFNSKYLKLLDPIQIPEAMIIANKIREAGHTDLLDCLIAATAIYLEGIFVTMDKQLIKIIRSIEELEKIEILTWSEFRKEITRV